jgi:uncharacterized paraquat-inducible protein A
MRSFNLAPDDRRTENSALNRCCRCDYEWRDLPFGHARYAACPKCGSVYWQWLDFERRD